MRSAHAGFGLFSALARARASSMSSCAVCAFRSGQRRRRGARGCGNRWAPGREPLRIQQCAGLEDLVRGMPVMLGEQAHQGVGRAPAPRCGAVTRRLCAWRRANREWPRRRRYNSVSTVDHRRRPATVHRAGWRLPCRLIQVVLALWETRCATSSRRFRSDCAWLAHRADRCRPGRGEKAFRRLHPRRGGSSAGLSLPSTV